ncbi:sensor histidine kinase [Catenulispora subtropica]|uniref:histidine kinase n=1 Tax=Catenulispora subtropica TaxID=450798 RepID=A0ABP5DQ20_9ACTN
MRFGGRAARGWRGDGAGPMLLLPLAFQVGVLPAASLVYVGGYGTGGSRPVLVLCAVLVAATAMLGLGAARGLPLRTVLAGDTVLAVAGNLALSVLSLPSDRAVEVSWQYFAGCVALWTMVRGIPGGLAAAAAGIPLRLAMFAAAGPVHTVRSAAVAALGDALVLLLAVVVAGAVLILLDQNAERLRTGIRRSLHDTVLQTLEAIALTLPNDAEQAPRRLREVRAVAHAEAVALRRQLSRPAGAPAGRDLVEGLVGLVAELARDGLRVRLDAAEVAPDALTAKRRARLLAATREALRNVLKHAGVADALIRVEEGAGGLTLTVRDLGVGFDPAAHQPGFGLSESITARIVEVGGTAGIVSRPGHGTSVTLWVPLEADASG